MKNAGRSCFHSAGCNWESNLLQNANYTYVHTHEEVFVYMHAMKVCTHLSSCSFIITFDACVTDVKCFPPGTAVPLVGGSVNKSIVEGEMVEFTCIFGANYDLVDDTVIWSVTLQNGNFTYIDDKTNTVGYVVTEPKQDCPHNNFSCCRFKTKLQIHSNMSLNGAAVTCHVIALEQMTSSTSYLSE